MKSIVYVSAALMLGASVYGFVDYRNTKSTKEFNEMYNPKKSQETAPDPVVLERKEPARNEMKKGSPVEEKVSATIEKTKNPAAVDESAALLGEKYSPSIENKSSAKKNKLGKKKKISHKIFSRAAPRLTVELPAAKAVAPPTKTARQ